MKRVSIFWLLLILALTACGPNQPSSEALASQNGIEVFDAWVRAAAPKPEMAPGAHAGGAVTGAFMLLKNSTDQPDVLISASSDVAKDVQIHETTMQDGVMSMAEVAGVTVPAGASTELKPGGYHVMLIGLQRELKVGETITLSLVFKNAGEITLQLPVRMP